MSRPTALVPLALAGAAALALAGAASAQPAPDFVSQAGASDKFEITSAQIARTRSHDPAIRRFAAKMIHDHTQSTSKVKMAARRVMGHNPPPPVLNPEQTRMISELRGARGPEFDRTYIDQQRQSHDKALSLMQGYAQNGDAPPLKRAAAQIAPVVQMHIDMLQHMGRRG